MQTPCSNSIARKATQLKPTGLRCFRQCPAAQRRTLLRSASSNGQSAPAKLPKSTGYLWHELYFWHCAGPWGSFKEFVQPMDHSPEHVETKRRYTLQLPL